LDNLILGNDGANTLRGEAGDDQLGGGLGADVMLGGTGDDLYEVDDAGDQVIELPGEGIDHVYASISYALTANVENLTLTGKGDLDGTGNDLDNTIGGNN